MQQSISRKDLRPGMFVVSHGQGTFEDPLVQVNRCLPRLDALDDVLAPQVDIVQVDLDRSVLVPATHLAEEARTANRLYTEALGYVRSFVDAVRRGTEIDTHAASPIVDGFIESVFRNEAATTTLFKLRGFDEYTYTHSLNVSILAVLFGKHLGLDRQTLREVGVAGMFHDIGKARIPETILNKPGKLTENEFAVMKSHPLEGYRLLRGKPDLTPEMLRAVLEHHERCDGTGYPRGLKGTEIGRFSRIISVVDVYDALTSRRVYKEPMAPAKALGLMYQWRDRDFTPQVIDNFIKCLGVFPVGSLVRLSGGEHALVVGANPQHPTRPLVKVILDAKMKPRLPATLDLDALSGTDQAQEIVQVLNPDEAKINLEPFFLS